MEKLIKRMISLFTLVIILVMSTSFVSAATCPPHVSYVKYSQKVSEDINYVTHTYLYIEPDDYRSCTYQEVIDVYAVYLYCSKCGIYLGYDTARPYPMYERGHVCGK